MTCGATFISARREGAAKIVQGHRHVAADLHVAICWTWIHHYE